jgi:DNA-binding winged helix-turn-helix (wHTH) protein
MPFRFGAFAFDPAARELRRDGALLALSPKAFRLLELLIEARPNPVARETLYRALWPDVVVEPGNLHGLVSEIRTTIGDRTIVRTVHRVGYAFTGIATAEEATRFSILLGDDEIPLRSGENLIGRDPRDAIAIHVPEVSRHHARIVVEGATVTIEDLGSKNGTFVGSERVIGARRVRPGDDIVVGTIRMWLIEANALATTLSLSRA